MPKFYVLVNCDESQEIVTDDVEVEADEMKAINSGDLYFIVGDREVRRFGKNEWLEVCQKSQS